MLPQNWYGIQPLLLTALLIQGCLAPWKLEGAISVGTLVIREGQVRLGYQDTRLNAGTITPLKEGQIVRTGAGARVVIHLTDGSTLFLGEHTQAVLLEFFDPDDGSSLCSIQLTHGSLRWEPGPDSPYICHLITPLGSLAYRDRWLECYLKDANHLLCRGAPGSQALWYHGQSQLLFFQNDLWTLGDNGNATRTGSSSQSLLLHEGAALPESETLFWRDYREFREHLRNLRQEIRQQINLLLLNPENQESAFNDAP